MGKNTDPLVMEKAVKTFESRSVEGKELSIREIQEDAASLLSDFNEIPAKPGSEAARLVAIAKTNLETSVMFATKAISRLKEGVNV